MNSVLLWLGSLLVAVLALLFAVPYAIDWNAYRGVFEEEATRILGRDVRVGGRVNLRLLPSPYVRFEQVRISDTETLRGEPIFRTQSFTLWLSTPPLLRGAIEVKRIELDGPELRLAVNESGRGNWEALRIVPGAMSYIPSEVVLQNVDVKNGILSVYTRGMPEPLLLSGIEGEISANSLNGPYRFRGSVDWQGARRDLRFATASADANGATRFKANLSVPASGSSYTLDGAISDLSARGRLTGDLSARIPVSRLAATPRQTSGNAAGQGASEKQPAAQRRASSSLDLKAKVAGDFQQVILREIAIAFEQNGRPQLLSGQASANWLNGITVRASLASRWLDLDRITSPGAGSGATASAGAPVEAAGQLITRLGALLPDKGNSLAIIDVDQVNLGGDAASDVHLALARAGGLTSIGEFRAGLPGNARVELRGTLGIADKGAAGTRAFDGEIVLHGTSLRRFSNWALGGAASAEKAAWQFSRGDGPFSLSSRLQLRPGAMALRSASVESGATRLSGDLDWSWERQRTLDLSIDATEIDLTSVAPGVLALRGRADGGQGEKIPDSKGTSGLLQVIGAKAKQISDFGGTVSLDLKTQRITDGSTTLHDVDAKLKIERSSVTFEHLRVATTTGLAAEVSGKLDRLDATPAGGLRGWLRASDPGSVRELVATLPAAAAKLVPAWSRHVGKVRLGFESRFGGRNPDALTLDAKGEIDDGAVSLELVLDGGLDGWRKAPVVFDLRLESKDVMAFAHRLGARNLVAPAPANPGKAQASLVPGTLMIKASGASPASLVTLARLDSSSLVAVYSGNTNLTDADELDLAGSLNIRANDGRDLLFILGSTHQTALPAKRVIATVDITRTKGRTTLASREIALGDNRLAAKLEMSSTVAGTLRLDGHIGMTHATMPELLGFVLDGRTTSNRSPAETAPGEKDAGSEQGGRLASAVAEDTPAWPAKPFSFRLLDRIEGALVLTSPRLQLDSGLVGEDAQMRIELKQNEINVSRLTARAMGGSLELKASIKPTTAGAQVTIDATVDNVRLSELGPLKAAAKPNGTANLRLSMTGRALSPLGAMAAMRGGGELSLRAARLTGIGADVVDATARKLIDGAEGITSAAIESAARQIMAAGTLDLGDRRLAVEIADGVLKIAAFKSGGDAAELTNTTTIDLVQLKFDSEWQIAPQKPLVVGNTGVLRSPLPPLSAVWTGHLRDHRSISPRLSTAALERELAVRKMERDVERLEEMRRLDEQRAREEEERQRQRDAEARRGLLPGVGDDASSASQRGGVAVPLKPAAGGQPPPAGAAPGNPASPVVIPSQRGRPYARPGQLLPSPQ